MPNDVPQQLAHDILIAAPVARVWALLTEAEHIRQWFAFDGAKIDLRPGGELVMTWKEHGTFRARIERVEPPHRFAYRWARLADEEPRPGDSTLVEFTLAPEGDGTRLRVVESGFRDLDLPAAEQARCVADNTQGWAGGLDALKSHAEHVAV